MPNLASALREEITRLARKELRGEIDALRKTSSHYRGEIAALKRRITDLEQRLKRTAKQAEKAVTHVQTDEQPVGKLRFRADGFRTLRSKKLGLSAEAMGKLLGVSGQSIYLWESGRSVPRASQLPAIAALRSIGKREAHARLAQL